MTVHSDKVFGVAYVLEEICHEFKRLKFCLGKTFIGQRRFINGIPTAARQQIRMFCKIIGKHGASRKLGVGQILCLVKPESHRICGYQFLVFSVREQSRKRQYADLAVAHDLCGLTGEAAHAHKGVAAADLGNDVGIVVPARKEFAAALAVLSEQRIQIVKRRERVLSAYFLAPFIDVIAVLVAIVFGVVL